MDVGEIEALSLLQDQQDAEFVSVETKLQMAPQDDLVAIFRALSGFSCMKQCFVKKIVSLPARALAAIISRQSLLQFLYLQNVSLSGEQEDFDSLAQAFRHHTGLRKIRLYMFRPSISTSTCLDSVVSAIAAIPCLEEVSLIHSKLIVADAEEQKPWDGKCLLDLCKARNLKMLTLTFSTELNDNHIGDISKALQTNKSIKNVSIRSNNLGKDAGVAVGRLLKSNSKLERLRLQLSQDDHAVPIVEALHENTNLQRLGLVLPRRENDKRLHLTDKLADMLRKSNYNLVQMDLVGLTNNVEEILFFLKVNQAGRKRLLSQGAARDQWVQTLISHNDDLSVMFYFLSKNPTLCLVLLRRMIALSSVERVGTSETRSALLPELSTTNYRKRLHPPGVSSENEESEKSEGRFIKKAKNC